MNPRDSSVHTDETYDESCQKRGKQEIVHEK